MPKQHLSKIYTSKESRELKSLQQKLALKKLNSGEYTFDEYLAYLKKYPYTEEDKITDSYESLKSGNISLADYMSDVFTSYPEDLQKRNVLFAGATDTLSKALKKVDLSSPIDSMSIADKYNYSISQEKFGDAPTQIVNKKVSDSFSSPLTQGLYSGETDNILLKDTSQPYKMLKMLLHEQVHSADDSIGVKSQNKIDYWNRPKEKLARGMADYLMKVFNRRIGKE